MVDSVSQAKEIFPDLFAEFGSTLGEQTVLDILNESELDEATARAILSGSVGESENKRGRSNSSRSDDEESDFEDDDDEEYGVKRRRSHRQAKARSKAKKAEAARKLEEDQAKAANEAEKAERAAAKKQARTRIKKEKTSNGSGNAEENDKPLESTGTPPPQPRVPREPLRIPVTQEENLEIEICRLEQELLAPRADDESDDEDEELLWKPPKWCVPIRADVRSFDFDALAKAQKELTGRLFDVIVTDPPWQLATSNPTRGVALGYDQLSDNFIRDMPFPKLQDNGFLFMWVINAKYRFALSLFELWGYELVDEITWIKYTVNRRLAKSHGFYLQHAKETCLVGRKGSDPPGTNRKAGGDVIFSERRGQSQKPTEIYEAIERLVPGGSYLEIFGRRNNTRDGFLTIGNEL